jgi:hypothetical protein
MQPFGNIYKVEFTININMTEALLYPLDRIQPSEILSQYSEWIYFTLVLVFFISIAGITLRKHFDSPYVKPMIISVGIMLTVGVFMYKEQLVMIFEGWGILGLVLLVLLVAIIPYGLCKGYGMPSNKALYLTYVLLYILSWVAFPTLFYSLADRNLGLVNLGLLIIFLISIFKLIPIKKSNTVFSEKMKKEKPFQSEIVQNISSENRAERILKYDIGKILRFEINNIKDMAEALAQIQRLVETKRSNFSTDDRRQIAAFLQSLAEKESLFRKGLSNLHRIFEQVGIVDVKQLDDLKKRAQKANKKERQILIAEIEREEQKLRIYSSIKEMEVKLSALIDSFNRQIKSAVDNLNSPGSYYAVKDCISKARVSLVDLNGIVEIIDDLKNKLIKIGKIEKDLLKKESAAA